MLSALLRKSRQLAADPVLRRWLVARALGRTPSEPAFTAHHPPYLGADWAGLAPETPETPLPIADGRPEGDIVLRLAGAEIRPGPDLFLRHWDDVETHLSLHRFAWVPMMEPADDPRWVHVLWRDWASRFATPNSSWIWHPYTAAERAANLLTFAQSHGLPEGASACLAAHAPVIARGLEWFGDHHTSNHCANNGRGLYLLGLTLGLPRAAEAGCAILLAEAKRLFRPSCVLREGSTHYHLLLARQWASVWLAACAHARPEADDFKATLVKALAVLPAFDLPGRFPLVGDVSPDCPPGHLFGLIPGQDPALGWTGLLKDEERRALVTLRESVGRVAALALAADGWLRADHGPWAGLWHAEPLGFSPMPGHGHQDVGAAEIHLDGRPLFVDAGRGSYRLAGEADPEVGALGHGGLTLDGADPYPQNRPYYAPEFRRSIAGPASLSALEDGVTLVHGGYARLGAPRTERVWRFEGRRLTLQDRINGQGRHIVRRAFVTPLPARLADGAVLLDGGRVRITADRGRAELAPIALWRAYGEAEPATLVTVTTPVRLPWSGRIIVEAD